MFSVCDIAIKNNTKILEPIFGWKQNILFSDIYDIDYFNQKMGQIIIVPIKNKNIYNIKKNKINLWDYSENILKKQRNINEFENDCMNIRVLKSLKLNKTNILKLNHYKNINEMNSIHIRIEDDWVKYSKNKNFTNAANYKLWAKLTNLNPNINLKQINNHLIHIFNQNKLNNYYFLKVSYKYYTIKRNFRRWC